MGTHCPAMLSQADTDTAVSYAWTDQSHLAVSPPLLQRRDVTALAIPQLAHSLSLHQPLSAATHGYYPTLTILHPLRLSIR